MQNQNLVIFNNRPIAADTSFTSSALWVGDFKLGSVQITFDANSTTVTGVYTLESSDDPIGQTPTTWSTVAGSSTTITAEADGKVFYNISEMGYNWLRVVFTYSGSSDAQVVNGRAVFKTQNQI